jgi:hypothetical protein
VLFPWTCAIDLREHRKARKDLQEKRSGSGSASASSKGSKKASVPTTVSCTQSSLEDTLQSMFLWGHLAPMFDACQYLGTLLGAPADPSSAPICLRLLPTMVLLWHMGRQLRETWVADQTYAPSPTDPKSRVTITCCVCADALPQSCGGGPAEDVDALRCPMHPMCKPCTSRALQSAIVEYLQWPAGDTVARASLRRGMCCPWPNCQHGFIVKPSSKVDAWYQVLPMELAVLAASACRMDELGGQSSTSATPAPPATPLTPVCSACGGLPGDVLLCWDGQPWRLRDHGPVFACPSCACSTCAQCGRDAHPGEACVTSLDRVPEDLLATAKIQDCPGCQTPATKDNFCNHMQCTKCTCHWCWACGQTLDPLDVTTHYTVRSPQCTSYSVKTEADRMKSAILKMEVPQSLKASALALLHTTFAQEAQDL